MIFGPGGRMLTAAVIEGSIDHLRHYLEKAAANGWRCQIVQALGERKMPPTLGTDGQLWASDGCTDDFDCVIRVREPDSPTPLLESLRATLGAETTP